MLLIPRLSGLKPFQADPGKIYLGCLPGLAQLDHQTQAAALEARVAQFRHLFVVDAKKYIGCRCLRCSVDFLRPGLIPLTLVFLSSSTHFPFSLA